MSPRGRSWKARAPAQRGRQARAAARDRSRAPSPKLVNGETKNLWPPIIDGVTVAKGYEKAIGAVLGDDLDAPVDPSAPMRWTNVGVSDDDPALPDGVEPLAAHVDAPPELARRLAQIGVVPKERGAELVSQLKTGQRLVSLEGDVWRWDGFVAAAHAPTGAARRLAERARLVDIEERAGTGPHRRRRQARRRWKTAEAELKTASAAETPRAKPGAPRSARPMPRASATPRPSARSTATPRANRR